MTTGRREIAAVMTPMWRGDKAHDEVHLKSYARLKPNATADLVAAVNV